MATDPWYVRELVADVPAEEFHAAMEDENWSDDADGGGSDDDETEDEIEGEEGDSDYSEGLEESSDESDSSEQGSGESVDSDFDIEATAAGHCPRSPSTSPPASPLATTPQKAKTWQGD